MEIVDRKHEEKEDAMIWDDDTRDVQAPDSATVRTNIDDESGDDNLQDDFASAFSTDDSTIFDEKKFFSIPSFPENLLKEAKAQIYSNIEGPLRRLEQEGHELLTRHQQERREKIAAERAEEERMIEKSLDDLLIRGDPREYQQQLLEIAVSRNTIVNLGTGSGKTLIALLCIKEKHAARDNGKRQTLFLVPSVALAIQQSLTLRANLPHFRIETACYATANSKRSREKLSECDVLCATHGAVRGVDDNLSHLSNLARTLIFAPCRLNSNRFWTC